jgi:FixJ family two-component response regulator
MRHTNPCHLAPSRWSNRGRESAEVAYLVDDDRAVRDALTGLLHASGVEVVGFESATGYLEYRRTDAGACLILDLISADWNCNDV